MRYSFHAKRAQILNIPVLARVKATYILQSVKMVFSSDDYMSHRIVAPALISSTRNVNMSGHFAYNKAITGINQARFCQENANLLYRVSSVL